MNKRTKILALILTLVMLIGTVAISVSAYSLVWDPEEETVYGADLLAPGAAFTMTDSVEEGLFLADAFANANRKHYDINTVNTSYGGNKYVQVISQKENSEASNGKTGNYIFLRGAIFGNRLAKEGFNITPGLSTFKVDSKDYKFARYFSQAYANSVRNSYFTLSFDFFADKYVYECTDGSKTVLALGADTQEALAHVSGNYTEGSAEYKLVQDAFNGTAGTYTKRAAYINSTGNYGNDTANFTINMYAPTDDPVVSGNSVIYDKDKTTNWIYAHAGTNLFKFFLNFEYSSKNGWELYAKYETGTKTKIATLPNTINESTHFDIIYDLTQTTAQFYMFVDGDYTGLSGNAGLPSENMMASYLIRITPEKATEAGSRIPYSMGFDNFSQNYYVSKAVADLTPNTSDTYTLAQSLADAEAARIADKKNKEVWQAAEAQYFRNLFPNATFPQQLHNFIQNKEYLTKSLLTVSDALYSTTDGTDGYVVSPTGPVGSIGAKTYYFKSSIENALTNGATVTLNKSVSNFNVAAEGVRSFYVNVPTGCTFSLSGDSYYMSKPSDWKDGETKLGTTYLVKLNDSTRVPVKFYDIDGTTLVDGTQELYDEGGTYVLDTVTPIDSLKDIFFDIVSGKGYATDWYIRNFDGRDFAVEDELAEEDWTLLDLTDPDALGEIVEAYEDLVEDYPELAIELVARVDIASEPTRNVLPNGALFVVTEKKTVGDKTYDVLWKINGSLDYTTMYMLPQAEAQIKNILTADEEGECWNGSKYAWNRYGNAITLFQYLMKHIGDTKHEHGYYVPNDCTFALVYDEAANDSFEIGFKSTNNSYYANDSVGEKNGRFQLHVSANSKVTLDLNGRTLSHNQMATSGNSWKHAAIFQLSTGTDFTITSSAPGANITQFGYGFYNSTTFTSGSIFTTRNGGVENAKVTVDGDNITFVVSTLLSAYNNQADRTNSITLNVDGGKFYAIAPTADSTESSILESFISLNISYGSRLTANIKDAEIYILCDYADYAFYTTHESSTVDSTITLDNSKVICGTGNNGFMYFARDIGTSTLTVNAINGSIVAGKSKSYTSGTLTFKLDNKSMLAADTNLGAYVTAYDPGFFVGLSENQVMAESITHYNKPTAAFIEGTGNTMLKVADYLAESNKTTTNYSFTGIYVATDNAYTLTFKDLKGNTVISVPVLPGTLFKNQSAYVTQDNINESINGLLVPETSPNFMGDSKWYRLAYAVWDTSAIAEGAAITQNYEFDLVTTETPANAPQNYVPVAYLSGVKLSAVIHARFNPTFYFPVVLSEEDGLMYGYGENNVRFLGAFSGNSQIDGAMTTPGYIPGFDHTWFHRTAYQKTHEILSTTVGYSVKYVVTWNGIEYNLSKTVVSNAIEYAEAVLDQKDCGSNDSVLALAILEYVKAMNEVLPEANRDDSKVDTIEGLLAAHKDCCASKLAYLEQPQALDAGYADKLNAYGAKIAMKYDAVNAGYTVYIPEALFDVNADDTTKAFKVRFVYETYSTDTQDPAGTMVRQLEIVEYYKDASTKTVNNCCGKIVVEEDGVPVTYYGINIGQIPLNAYDARAVVEIKLLNSLGETIMFDHDENAETDALPAFGYMSLGQLVLNYQAAGNTPDYNATKALYQLSVAQYNYKFKVDVTPAQ